MQSTDADTFRNLLRMLGRTFGSDPDPVVLDAYWLALQDWDLADFRAACAHLLRTSRFMPRPADFHDLRKSQNATAGEAWASVRKYLQYSPSGYQTQPGAPDLVARSIAAVGGANAIAFCDVDKAHFLEQRFCRHYDEISGRDGKRTAMLGFDDDPSETAPLGIELQ